jgi:transposase
MELKRVGLDLAKNVFQVHGVDGREVVRCRRQLRRSEVLKFFAGRPPCLIGMEACAGAHYWARELTKLGHTVRLMAPQLVKPYIKSQKNDANDAEGICEAAGRPNMRFVPVKTVAQQEVQTAHRIRRELIRQRTAKANQIRGLLAEFGLVVERRIEVLRRALPKLLEAAAGNGLGAAARRLLEGLRGDLVQLDERVGALDAEIKRVAKEDAACVRLQTIPGIGPLTASALVSAVGDGRQFKNGRQLAAWVGLVPKQDSSGGKTRLLGISKHGDTYLRTLLIHGARAVQQACATKTDARSHWLRELGTRRHRNIAAVALANRNARIAWVLLTREQTYQAPA